MAKIIEVQPTKTAQEFLDALSPFNARWELAEWIYRGQRDDSWKLVPSAMRPGALDLYAKGLRVPRSPSTIGERITIENDLVFDFVSTCLEAGLAVPEDGQWIRNGKLQELAFGPDVIQRTMQQGVDVPFPLYRSLYALAQHHGVPTRLLDWSQSGLVAAYFACVDVARTLAETGNVPRKTKGKNVAVYALRRQRIRELKELKSEKAEPKRFGCAIEEVEAPYAENPNLRAQRGTFTLVTYESPRPGEDELLPPVEDVLRDWCAWKYGSAEADRPDFPFLYKITTPLAESRALLYLLRKAGVWAPTIRPNYDAARAAAIERWYWPAPQGIRPLQGMNRGRRARRR